MPSRGTGSYPRRGIIVRNALGVGPQRQWKEVGVKGGKGRTGGKGGKGEALIDKFVFGLTLAVILKGAAIGAQPDGTPRLPEPVGPFGIGRVAYHWTDSGRSDPFSANASTRRELMVYIWYPTAADDKTGDGVYQPDAARIDARPGAARFRQSRIWPLIVSGAIKSHARDDAPLAVTKWPFPIVLFSHGDTAANSFSYTTAIEDLASRGYVVAAIEHPYSSSAVAFPDGRVIFADDRQRLRGDRPSGVSYFEGVEIAMREMRRLGDVEGADLRFVVDQLQRLDSSDRSSPFFRRLDFSRIAAVGHSLGGMAAVRACQLDARIKACVNLDGGTADGAFLKYADARPLRQPFLFVEATPPPTFTDEQLRQRGITRADWARNTASIAASERQQLGNGLAGSYKVQLRAPGINHMSFLDVVLSATTEDARQRALHNLKLTTEVTRTFLDKILMGRTNTLFDLPNRAGPEINIESFQRQ